MKRHVRVRGNDRTAPLGCGVKQSFTLPDTKLGIIVPIPFHTIIQEQRQQQHLA